MMRYAGIWLPWFAWYPVRLQNGQPAWLRHLEWNVESKLIATRGGIYTKFVPTYRVTRRTTSNRKP